MKVISRIRQRITASFIEKAGIPEPKLITGLDSPKKLAEIIKNDNHCKVLVMTSAGFIKRGSLEIIFEQFKNNGIEYLVYSEVMPDPTIICIEEAVKVYDDNACDAIFAVGGGSVMDAAKVVGARVANPDVSVRDMQDGGKIKNPIPDLYAMPTTAGTGSEATVAAVVTDEVDGSHYKYSVINFGLVPKYAVMYPQITLSLPPHITAATGMDALTHAVETYTNLYATDRVNKLAKKAVKMIFSNLKVAYEDGSNIEARSNMLNASYYAGVAFTNNFVGYVHAVSHALGALYGIPHGQANAIVLPYVMDQYGSKVYKPLSNLATVVGIEGDDDADRAEKFIEAIRQMNKDMGIPDKVDKLQESDFDTIVTRAMKEANPAYPVPVIWGEEDFKLLLRRLLPR